jgi:PPOX class probable F420-dependent enzyme
MIDLSTENGVAVVARLERELIVWLTTVSPDGQPQSSPVWFVWDQGEFLVFSLAVTPRVRNIRANPRVALNLNSDPTADDVVTFEGEARIVEAVPPPSGVPEFVAKYRHLMDENSWTVERYFTDYPLPIRIRPTRLRLG